MINTRLYIQLWSPLSLRFLHKNKKWERTIIVKLEMTEMRVLAYVSQNANTRYWRFVTQCSKGYNNYCNNYFTVTTIKFKKQY
uniref:Uncharacterized protein n=1 Tax=Panagrolaimus sp. ES5 TaxID=591445 RepID=A0AC34G449_9BILA